jgi:RNA polymerase sigma factor (TIGR02999 family)
LRIKSNVMSDVTRLLDSAAAGDRQAAADLLPLVYDELRALAAARMAVEAPGHTLNATALVHEAYLRLVGDQHFDGRRHFFAAAAEAMRRILVEAARRKAAVRHGGGRRRMPLEDAHRIQESPEGLLDLDDALNRFAVVEPAKASGGCPTGGGWFENPTRDGEKVGRRIFGNAFGRKPGPVPEMLGPRIRNFATSPVWRDFPADFSDTRSPRKSFQRPIGIVGSVSSSKEDGAKAYGIGVL